MDGPMEELAGGGVNRVHRAGDLVLRPTGPWTPRVHGLLRHVRARGFTAAPEVRGIGADGREALSFLPGEIGHHPLSGAAASHEALVSAARLLRAYHDATADYAAAHAEGWQLPVRPPVEVVCHSDFAPYNCVLDGTTAVGMIDFDTAHPGPRVWDVAYSVYRWAPLTDPTNADGFGTIEQQAARARDFCDAYGLGDADRTILADTIVDRLEALVELIRTRAAAGDAAFRAHLEDGHDRLYLRDVAHVREHRETITARLLRQAGFGA